MDILLAAGGLLLATLVLVVFFGAPYVPTRGEDVGKAIEMSGLKPGELLVDLGCGDGRLLLAAAKRGIRADGYELNPMLVLVSKWRTRRYKKLVNVYLRNYWKVALPEDTKAVFVFLAEPYMKRLERYLTEHIKRHDSAIILISYAFELPGHKVQSSDKALLRYKLEP